MPVVVQVDILVDAEFHSDFVAGVTSSARGFSIAKVDFATRVTAHETALAPEIMYQYDVNETKLVTAPNDGARPEAVRGAIQGLCDAVTNGRLVCMKKPYSSRGLTVSGLLYDASFIKAHDGPRSGPGSMSPGNGEGGVAVRILVVDGILVPNYASEMSTLARMIDACSRKRYASVLAAQKAGGTQAAVERSSSYCTSWGSFVLYATTRDGGRGAGAPTTRNLKSCDRYGTCAIPSTGCSSHFCIDANDGKVCRSNAWRGAVADWPSLLSTLTEAAEIFFGVRVGANVTDSMAGTRPGRGSSRGAAASLSGKMTNAAMLSGGEVLASNKRSGGAGSSPPKRPRILGSILDRFGWKQRKVPKAFVGNDFVPAETSIASEEMKDDLANLIGVNVDSLFGVGLGKGSAMKPSALRRRHLQCTRVLGQVSQKYIVAVARTDLTTTAGAGEGGGTGDNFLIVLDQHAADERVQLEDMHAEAFGSPYGRVDAERMFPSAAVLLPAELALSESEAAALRAYEGRIKHWGWDWTDSTHANVVRAGGGGECTVAAPPTGSLTTTISITRVPVLLGMNVLGVLPFHQYLLELLEVGGALRPPTSFLNLLASKSCRQAIMFGDHLCDTTMREVVNRLSRTKLPFMCAHGRPTAAPLLNISVAQKAVDSLEQRRRGSVCAGRLARTKALMDAMNVSFESGAEAATRQD